MHDKDSHEYWMLVEGILFSLYILLIKQCSNYDSTNTTYTSTNTSNTNFRINKAITNTKTNIIM